MNSPEFKDTVCRICLDENVVLNWSNILSEYGDISYKDCYYKYTQLKPLDVDPFSSMLCQMCSNGLENVHALIMKAIDSHNFLLDVNCIESDVECSVIMEDGLTCSTDFETVLLDNPDTESVIHEEFEYDTSYEPSIKNEETQYQEIVYMENESEDCDVDESLQIDTEDNVSKSMNSLSRNLEMGYSTKRERRENTSCEENYNELKNTRHIKGLNKASGNELIDNKNKNSISKRSKLKRKQDNNPSMCSFCSKVLHNKYALKKHEKTHEANRERKAPCPICGVKFLEESYVRIHMQIHNDNREKKHKCEFCDKAFFEKGSLNVHRRIHLGQMIPCTICSKEFFRQVDLDIHMSSHSETLITAATKKKSKYWVRCKYCNKDIMSTNFKSHTAVHLNEPLMKCSICGKEFFRRDSCTEHVKTIHKKRTDYKEYIILYQKNRLSHLYLEQTAELRVNED